MLLPMLWKRDASENNNRYDLLNPFEEMDRMMNDFFGGGFAAEPFAGLKTDVIENEHNYQLEADLPGFDKEDIHVDLKDDTLTITAQHEEKNEEKKDGKYIRRERGVRSFTRSFHVEGMQPEDISAQYKNGVLIVTVPKKEALPENEAPARIAVTD